MDNFVKRFDEMLDFIGVSAYKLSKQLGISESAISSIRGGKTKPSFDFLSKLLTIYEALNADYLLTGRGQLTVKIPLKNVDRGGRKHSFSAEFESKNTKSGGATNHKVSPTVSATVSATKEKHYKISEELPDQVSENDNKYHAFAPLQSAENQSELPTFDSTQFNGEMIPEEIVLKMLAIIEKKDLMLQKLIEANVLLSNTVAASAKKN